MTVENPTMKSKTSVCVEKYCKQLTPRKEVLPEKVTGPQVTKKFPAFYGTRSFVTVFTTAHHLFLFTATSIQSMLPQPTSLRFILILPSCVTYVFHVVSLPQVSPPQPYMHLSFLPYVPHAPVHLVLVDLISRIICV